MIRAVVFDYGGVLRRRLLLQTNLLDVALDLKKDGVKIAVLSNMIKPVAAVFRGSKELTNFSPVIISCDIGLSKPKPAIYKIMLEQLQIPAHECVFIDNRADNIAAAKMLGFQVIQAHSTGQIIDDLRHLLESN